MGNRKINKYNLFYKYTTKGIILDLLGSNYCISLQRKAESMKDKISLNKSEIEKLNTLASDKSVYLRYKNSKMKDITIRSLMEKFDVFSLENILRSAYYYGFIEFKDKKYQHRIFKLAAKQSKQYCKYREAALQIGFECPEELCYFYFDIYKLKQDKLDENIKATVGELQSSIQIKKYLDKYKNFINTLNNEEKKNFIHIYRQLLTVKENNKISLEMKNLFNSNIAGIACQIRNYIDDVFPIFIIDLLDKDELHFVKFIASRGNGIDYILKYNKTINWLKQINNRLIKKCGTKNLNELTTLYLIEKNYQADNRAYLNLLLNINIDNVLKNLKLISRLIVRTNKPKVEQIMTSLNELRVSKNETIVTSQHYKQLSKLINEAINQNII